MRVLGLFIVMNLNYLKLYEVTYTGMYH